MYAVLTWACSRKKPEVVIFILKQLYQVLKNYNGKYQLICCFLLVTGSSNVANTFTALTDSFIHFGLTGSNWSSKEERSFQEVKYDKDQRKNHLWSVLNKVQRLHCQDLGVTLKVKLLLFPIFSLPLIFLKKRKFSRN